MWDATLVSTMHLDVQAPNSTKLPTGTVLATKLDDIVLVVTLTTEYFIIFALIRHVLTHCDQDKLAAISQTTH